MYVLPTLHRIHATNTQYNYDSIQAVISRINPDVVAVEIRPEDETADTSYLKQFYPLEMWMMRYWQPNAVVKGFDWLGKELEGKPVPERYWQDQSWLKALQQKLSADTVYQKKLEACALYTKQRMPALQSSSLKAIMQGTDGQLVRAYYECLTGRLRGSDYEALPNFYAERDKHIQQNVIAISRQYPGKTIVVLTGADHYPFLVDAVRREKDIVLRMPF